MRTTVQNENLKFGDKVRILNTVHYTRWAQIGGIGEIGTIESFGPEDQIFVGVKNDNDDNPAYTHYYTTKDSWVIKISDEPKKREKRTLSRKEFLEFIALDDKGEGKRIEEIARFLWIETNFNDEDLIYIIEEILSEIEGEETSPERLLGVK